MTTARKLLVALAATVLLGGVAVGYVRLAGARGGAGAPVAAGRVSLADGPELVFRSTAAGSAGHLAALPLPSGAVPSGAVPSDAVPPGAVPSGPVPSGPASPPAGPVPSRTVAALDCARFHAAGGTGVCLRPDGALSTFQVAVLDADLAVRRSIPLVGVPNRARVSPSGRMVAWTVFVTGDSYNGGQFSTRAGILDTRTGNLAGSLEEFAVTRDGRPYRAADLNFWGVTFTADDNRFYATMSTAGRRYLVEGDFAARTVRTLAENVECPSLSPDGGRIVFKSAVGGDPGRGWRLATMALATGRRTELAESRSVDDQAIWLDDHTVAYGLRRDGGHADVWAVPADGSGAPRLLVPDAESPAALD
ncbi:hypothetical protein AB0J86_37850 [Micromonospora sp. NPDC049559]|uniref:TolB family protein n=1 Tax=Micromonospora sp. NPDC049559 TaxID=3155923 RepID=UPI00342DD216